MQTDLFSHGEKKLREVLIQYECVYKSWVTLWLSCNSLLYTVASSIPVTEMISAIPALPPIQSGNAAYFFSLQWPPLSLCMLIWSGSCSSLPAHREQEWIGSMSLTDTAPHAAERPHAGGACRGNISAITDPVQPSASPMVSLRGLPGLACLTWWWMLHSHQLPSPSHSAGD